MVKFIGKQYGLDNTTDASGDTVFANSRQLGGYVPVDAALGFRSAHGGASNKDYSVSVDVNNLFDMHKLTGYAGMQANSGGALYFGLPGRSVFFDLSMKP